MPNAKDQIVKTVNVPSEIVIENEQQLVAALKMRDLAREFLKRFEGVARSWVDKYGPAQSQQKQWGCKPCSRETKVNMSISELETLLADLGTKPKAAERIVDALRRRGAGEQTQYNRYVWHKIPESKPQP